jgi:hypothetical protein
MMFARVAVLVSITVLGASTYSRAGGLVTLAMRAEASAAAGVAVAQGRAISPLLAAERVAAFWGVPPFPVRVVDFVEGPSGPDYSVQVGDVPAPYRGSYHLRGDGSLRSAVWVDNRPAGVALNVSSTEALQTAIAFLGERYSPFAQGEWRLEHPRWWEGNDSWHFTWHKVVDPAHDTVDGDGVEVWVHKASGLVESIKTPSLIVSGPTAPLVSRQDAELQAAQVSPVPVAQFPFLEARLEVIGPFGQFLEWTFIQEAPLPPPHSGTQTFSTHVDALTGEAYTLKPLGPAPPKVHGRPPLPANFPWPRVPPTPARLRVPGGKPVGDGFTVMRREGQLWTRVELLLPLGAQLAHDPDGARLFFGVKRRTNTRVLGGFRKDNGWWVPLRPAARALGWQVRWDAKQREAVILTGRPVLPPPLAPGGGPPR